MASVARFQHGICCALSAQHLLRAFSTTLKPDFAAATPQGIAGQP